MKALKYAVRPALVLKHFGQLCVALSFLTLAPLGVSIFAGDFHVSLRYGVLIVVIFGAGFLLMRLPAPKRVQTNEAMAITAMIFLFSSLAMAWPTTAAGFNFLDALFETISAVTTTGLTVAGTMKDKPLTFLFARAWMQWVGGLGIVVLSLAAMYRPGVTAKRLGDMEDYDEDLVGGTRHHARRVLAVYSILTAVGVAVLMALKTGWFDSIVYSLAAVSTGGFAPYDNSLMGLQSVWSQSLVTLLCLAGGVSMVLYHRAIREQWTVLPTDIQFRGYIVTCLIITLLLTGFLWLKNGMDFPEALRHGAMNALSAQSTAGFSSIPIAGLDAGSKLLLIFSMVIGGGVGSTSGGIKILRLIILLRLLQLMISRTAMPRQAVSESRLSGRRLDGDEIVTTLCLILIFLICIAISWLPFLVMGYSPLDSLFEVVSALGTAGISAGIAGPELHPLLKVILCVDMLLGRLEIFAWLVLLAPGTWIGKRMGG